MIIKKSFFFLLVLFTVIGSCRATNIEEIPPEIDASRSWSLVAPKEKSIMSALFMSLFSIPTVRRRIILEAYRCDRNENLNDENLAERTKQYFTSYLGNKLKELIVTKGLVVFEQKFLDGYTSTSLAEAPQLWNDFHGAFVAPLQNLFVFTFDVSVAKSSGQVLETKSLNKCARVYLDGVYSSLAELIAHDFYSEQSNQRFQERFALKSNLSVRYNFSAFPEVLVFEFKRFVLEDAFLDRPFQLQKELTISGHVYRMASRLEFDAKEQTFSCVALDFQHGLEYVYDHNGSISMLESPGDLVNDTKSIFAFYTKVPAVSETQEQCVETSLTANVETEHLNHQQQEQVDHQEHEPRGIKRKADEVVDLTTGEFDDEQLDFKWSLVYRPDISKIPQLLREKYIALEAKLKSKIREWPLEFMNLYSKLITKTYLLGSESYSFKPGLNGRPYGALEVFLSCLAANEKAVSDLFDAFEAGQQTEIQQMITVVILKMLLGCKNIPLDKIAKAFLKYKVFLGLSSTNYRIDSDFKTNFKQILKIFGRKDLIEQPMMNTEQYVDLDSDDPQKVAFNVHTSTAIKPLSIIPSRERVIKGLWYDYCNLTKSVRQRNIYKSNSEMFVIEIDRMVHVDKNIVFDTAEVSLNEGEYECIGVVSFTNTDQENIIVFTALNSFQNNTTYRAFSPGMEAKIYEASEPNTKYFNDLKKYTSIMLIYTTKKGAKTASRPKYTGLIQNNLIKAAFRDYAEETGVKLK